jgi:hypothetical protein
MVCILKKDRVHFPFPTHGGLYSHVRSLSTLTSAELSNQPDRSAGHWESDRILLGRLVGHASNPKGF